MTHCETSLRRPDLKTVGILLAAQLVGATTLIAISRLALFSNLPSHWFGLLGFVLATLVFGIFRERRTPGLLFSFLFRLSLISALVGGLFLSLFVLTFVYLPKSAFIPASNWKLLLLTLFNFPIGCVLFFSATWIGLRLGVLAGKLRWPHSKMKGG